MSESNRIHVYPNSTLDSCRKAELVNEVFTHPAVILSGNDPIPLMFISGSS